MDYITHRTYPPYYGGGYQGPAEEAIMDMTVVRGLDAFNAATELLNKFEAECYNKGVQPLEIWVYKKGEDLIYSYWRIVAFAFKPGTSTQIGPALFWILLAAAVFVWAINATIISTTELFYGPGGTGGGLVQSATLLIGGALLVTALTRFKWGVKT